MISFVPGKFSEEIKRGNCAVAWPQQVHLSELVRFCELLLCLPVVTAADTSLLHGVVASIVYAILGIILFVTGYMFINLWHRKYNLSEEIMRGNTAAGILVFGIFVGLALVVSGAEH